MACHAFWQIPLGFKHIHRVFTHHHVVIWLPWSGTRRSGGIWYCIRRDLLVLENALENPRYALAVGTSRLPPWWRFRLYHHVHKRLLGDPYWCDQTSQPSRWTRIRPHGYEMELSASDWMERYALHTGAFYSNEVMATVMAELSVEPDM